MEKKIRVKLTKSTIGALPKHRKIVEALGLRKMNSTNELPDTPQSRGAVKKVEHLVTLEEI